MAKRKESKIKQIVSVLESKLEFFEVRTGGDEAEYNTLTYLYEIATGCKYRAT